MAASAVVAMVVMMMAMMMFVPMMVVMIMAVIVAGRTVQRRTELSFRRQDESSLRIYHASRLSVCQQPPHPPVRAQAHQQQMPAGNALGSRPQPHPLD